MFSYVETPAHFPLDQFIRCFWFLKADAAESSGPQKVLPDGCMEIVIHIGAPFQRIRNNASHTQAAAFLVGQLTECFVLENNSAANVMGVRFRPAGTAIFMPFDLSEIQNEEITLESLWGGAGRSLQDIVIDAKSDDDRIRAIERFLMERLRPERLDARIGKAVRLIEHRRGRIAVSEISARVGWSVRQLERQFLNRIGVGPKALLRTLRFQTLLQLARSGTTPDWASLAVDCGFFDQAHLIHEFRRFAGEPPEVFLGQDYTLYEFFALYEAMSDFSNTSYIPLQ
jgi:AraC-like DNA-binding protein